MSVKTERGMRLKEQFINGINDDDMMTEIIKEVTVIKKDQQNNRWTGVELGKKSRNEKSTKSTTQHN